MKIKIFLILIIAFSSVVYGKNLNVKKLIKAYNWLKQTHAFEIGGKGVKSRRLKKKGQPSSQKRIKK